MAQSKIQLLATDPRALWTPRNLPNAVHWWRADLGITAPSNIVSQWTDQISGTNLTQPTAVLRPGYLASTTQANGKAALEFFSVSSQFLSSSAAGLSFTAGDDVSIITVQRGKTTGSNQFVYSQGVSAGTVFTLTTQYSTASTLDTRIGHFDAGIATTTDVDADVLNLNWTGVSYNSAGGTAAINVFSNEQFITPAGSATANLALRSFDPFRVGADGQSGTPANFFDGYICEIIVTKGFLRQQDLSELANYMLLRYDIQSPYLGTNLTESKVYLDLYDADPMLLNFQIDDYQELPTISSNFSRTFRIPATGTNNKFFQNAFYVNSTDYDVSVKVPADIFVDGEFFRKGQIRLNKIYTNEFSDRTDYEIFFLGESKDFAGQVGEGFLNSLLCFDLNHELLMANIVTSWDAVEGTSNGLLNGDVVYPLVDMGYDYNEDGSVAQGQIGISATFTGQGYARPFISSADRIERTYFRPWIRAKYLIDKIFEGTDYTYTSNFFTSNLFDGLYVNATGNTAQATINGEVGSAEFEVIQAGQTLQIVSAVPNIIEYPTTISDPSDVMSLTTLVAPVTGTYVFEYTTEIRTVLSGAPNPITHTYSYQRNGLGLTTIGTFTTPGSVSNLTTSFTTDATYVGPGTTVLLSPLSLSLNAGDSVVWYVTSNHAPSAASSVTLPFSQLICTQAPIQISNPCALLQDDVKTIDFFKSIVNLFKLVVAPDPANDNNFIIEPYNDYIGSGTLRDWTDKLDTSVDFQIEPIFFNNTATINFAYSADADFFNLENETKFKEVFGTYIYDSQQELLNDTRRMEVVFSPTILAPIVGTGPSSGGTDFVLPRLVTVEPDEAVQVNNNYAKVSPIRPNIRLCFYNGKRNGGVTWYYDTDLGVAATSTTYPLMSPYLDPPGATGATGLNLNFEDEPPYYLETASNVVSGQPTVYDEYWSQFVEEQYSPFARKFIGNFVLNHYDLKDFQFSDVIFVKDSYYRVLKIKDVQVGETNSTQVELLKLLNYVPEFILPVAGFTYSIADDGITVTFTNTSTDATSYSWNFGDGNTSTATNPVHVYDRVDGTVLFPTRTVTLTATNVFGSDSDTQAFQVETVPTETQAWWRASEGITLNGSDVASWEDIIQSIPLSQATAARQPVWNATDANFNNKPSISFTRTNLEYLVSPLTYPNYAPHTAGEDTAYMFIYKSSFTGNHDIGLLSRTGGFSTFNCFGYFSSQTFCRFDNQVATSTTLQNLGTPTQWNAANWMFATYKASNGAYDFRRDNTSVLSGTGNINGTWASTTAWFSAGVGLGNGVNTPNTTGGTSYWQGQIVEMWLLHKDLDATDRANFASYLATRYNL